MDGQREQRDWFLTAAGAVGDLGNPFYDEERRRDVWNEASAVGFQTMLALGLAAAVAMIWIGGPPAQPYVMVMIGVTGLGSIVTLSYAERLGVSVTEASTMGRWRMVPYLLLVVALAAGLLVRGGTEFDAATVAGAVTGAGIVIVALVWTGRRARRRAAAEEVGD